jgi:hypothetical protein
MFGGSGLAGTGLGGIQSLASLPATAAEVAPEAMGQVTSALNAASPTISSASQLASAGPSPFEISPDELQASQNVVSEAAPRAAQDPVFGGPMESGVTSPITQQASGTLTQGLGGAPNLTYAGAPATSALSGFGGIKDLIGSGIQSGIDFVKENPKTSLAAALAYKALNEKQRGVPAQAQYSGPLSKFQYDPSKFSPTIPAQPTPYQPVYQNYRGYADGGMMDAGANPGMMMQGGNDPLAFQSTGVERMASGGISSLGRYSDGGQMLKGPGDGMSDSIPATIANKQPARLANDEFVVPADVVSHLGNGSSDAGAKQLYSMMNRVRKARTGTTKQGKQINPTKYIPA